MNDKKKDSLCLEVRKDIQLDIMNDSTNYTATGRQITPDDPNHETNKKDGTTKTIKYKKIVLFTLLILELYALIILHLRKELIWEIKRTNLIIYMMQVVI